MTPSTEEVARHLANGDAVLRYVVTAEAWYGKTALNHEDYVAELSIGGRPGGWKWDVRRRRYPVGRSRQQRPGCTARALPRLVGGVRRRPGFLRRLWRPRG